MSQKPLNFVWNMQLKKIEDELITYAKENNDVYVIESDKYYTRLCKDIKD
jgi:hypothetical protein